MENAKQQVVSEYAKQRTQYDEDNAKLCLIVKEHTCLYDRFDSNYLKKEFIDEAWRSIAVQCKDSGKCNAKFSFG